MLKEHIKIAHTINAVLDPPSMCDKRCGNSEAAKDDRANDTCATAPYQKRRTGELNRNDKHCNNGSGLQAR